MFFCRADARTRIPWSDRDPVWRGKPWQLPNLEFHDVPSRARCAKEFRSNSHYGTKPARRVRAPGLQEGGFVADVGRVPSPGALLEGIAGPCKLPAELLMLRKCNGR